MGTDWNLRNYEIYKTISYPIRLMKAIEDAQGSEKFKVCVSILLFSRNKIFELSL